jgi:glycosyltransferase involved in cell wall biosynthesis
VGYPAQGTGASAAQAADANNMKVAFVTSHPIQYQAPVFREIAQRAAFDFEVLFAMLPDAATQGADFGVAFEWDVPLLRGYRYRVLKNVSRQPSVTQFRGCDTPELYSLFRRERFDAVVVNGWVVKSCLQALAGCRRAGVPCLVRGEANDLRNRRWWVQWLQARLVRQYAGCLAIGSANRQFYIARGVNPENIFSAPYCIDAELFRQAANPELRRSARNRWGIPESAVCFLYSGKFVEKKHPVELLHAFANSDARHSAVLLCVGDGPLKSDCERLANEQSLPVRFAGFLNQTEMVGAYAACDCLVMPSDAGETWGLVVNEAMTAGKPALVSDLVGCQADLVTPGVTGGVFPFGNWSELSRQLAELACDQPRLDKMGAAAAERIVSYSPKVAADGIVSAVETVVQRRSRRSVMTAGCTRSVTTR